MTTAKYISTQTSHISQAKTVGSWAPMRTVLLWSQALLLGFLALAMPHPAQAGKEITFGDYTGSLQGLRLDSMPANTRVDTDNKSYINFFWEVKDKEGLINTALVQYRVYDRKTTNGYCGTTYSPQVCAFDQAGIRYAAELYVHEYDYNRREKVIDANTTATYAYDIIKNNVKREELGLVVKGPTQYDRSHVLPKMIGNYHYLAFMKKRAVPPEDWYEIHSFLHAGNVHVKIEVRCKNGLLDALPDRLMNEIIAKLPRTGKAEEPVAAVEVEEKAPPVENPNLMVEAYPAPSSAQIGRTAYLPASTKLPAKLVAKTKPGTATTFEIVSGKQAQLQAGANKGTRLTVKADSNGVAETLFFYTGPNIKAPLAYEVRISTPGRRETVTVNVGLGLAFDRIQAVKGDMLDTHAFTLGVKSRFHPKLNLGDQAFFGTTKIVTTPAGESVLVVGKNEAPGEPQYYFGKNLYPAVVMKSDGKHAYQINGGIVLLDSSDAFSEFIQEGMQQGQALALVSRDTPEHWLTSLVCSLEAQDEVQYAMLETAKMLPGGDVVDALTSATGLMCKFGKGEYESLFYDLGTIVGGKYLDHLNQPEVLTKLTPKQQSAAKLAKKAYDKLDEHKKGEERDKWIGAAGERFRNSRTEQPAAKQPPPPAPSSAPAPTPAQPGNDLKKNVEDLQKSFEELGNTFKGIFK
ncbi:MAG: hypothetical protein NT087_07410 [Deltaproteobacteria bacterium]|nr:hypothetical protein [Deltaproteobacteria bacterium]